MAAATETGPVEPAPEAKWQGYVEPYVVGDPGRAAAGVVPLPDETAWDRKDTVLDAFTLREGRTKVVEVRAASVRGLAHRAYGRVRQDEYACRRTTDGRYLVICVADGVSSGEFSHKAAMIATRWGAKALAGILDRSEPAALPWGPFVHSVASQIERYGRKLLRGREDIDAEKCELRDHRAQARDHRAVRRRRPAGRRRRARRTRGDGGGHLGVGAARGWPVGTAGGRQERGCRGVLGERAGPAVAARRRSGAGADDVPRE